MDPNQQGLLDRAYQELNDLQEHEQTIGDVLRILKQAVIDHDQYVQIYVPWHMIRNQAGHEVRIKQDHNVPDGQDLVCLALADTFHCRVWRHPGRLEVAFVGMEWDVEMARLAYGFLDVCLHNSVHQMCISTDMGSMTEDEQSAQIATWVTETSEWIADRVRQMKVDLRETQLPTPMEEHDDIRAISPFLHERFSLPQENNEE